MLKSRFKLVLWVLFWCPTSAYPVDRIVLPQKRYCEVFHKLVTQVTTTTRRLEERLVVLPEQVQQFVDRVEQILGDEPLTDPKLKRLQFREKPESDDEMFITDTDYFPVVKGAIQTEKGTEEANKAYIRMRRYFRVPKGTSTVEILKHPQRYEQQKLVDQPGPHIKLEFKVGAPQLDLETGIIRDRERVVDKPGFVASRSDVDELFGNKGSFIEHKGSVLERAKSLTHTSGKVAETKPINKQALLETMVDRIGLLHESIPDGSLKPHHRSIYQRTAYVVVFEHPPEMMEQGLKGKFEIQFTIDKDVLIHFYETGETLPFEPNDRVLELKIPTEYASLSESELTQMGLGELAQIRTAYQSLDPRSNTKPNKGKTANAPLRQTSSE